MMIELDDNEAALVRSLIRTEIKHKRRGQAQAIVKWGKEYDPTAHEAKVSFLRSLYAKFVEGTTGAQFLADMEELS